MENFAEFNFIDGTITIDFSETIKAPSLNVSGISLQTLYENPVATTTLTSSKTTSPDGPSITTTLAAADLETISSKEHLCTQRATCYLVVTKGVVEDMSGNQNEATGTVYPGKIAVKFNEDTTRPRLTGFTLDLTSNKLTLSFDEPIMASRLKATEISLQSAARSLGENFELTLTGGTVLSSDGSADVEIELSTVDLNEHKRLSFATSNVDTYLRLTQDAAQDMAFRPNNVVEITALKALNVTKYVSDSVPPTLTSFNLDLDKHHLVLTFDER